MSHICAKRKEEYAIIIFFIGSLVKNGGLGACPRTLFRGNTLLNVGKLPFTEWNVTVFIIGLHAKIEKLDPLPSFIDI